MTNIVPKMHVHEEWYNIFKGSSWPNWQEFVDMQDYTDIPINLQREIIDVILNFPKYQNTCAPYLRHNFTECKSIKNSYSDSWQDMFVLTMLDGKRNGSFLEIGANMPVKMTNQPSGVGYNNTYLLETQFGFKGISVDIINYLDAWNDLRPNSNFVQTDALTCDYEKLCLTYNVPMEIDYLQIDIDPAINSFKALKNILNTSLRFSVITYETNIDFEKDRVQATELQAESKKLLEDNGYTLLIPNVGLTDTSNGLRAYEDWYIDESKISKNISDKFNVFKNSNTVIAPYKIFLI
jgi:hypothetical protein